MVAEYIYWHERAWFAWQHYKSSNHGPVSTSATANFCRYSFAQFLVLSCTVVALIYSSADYLSKIWPYALYKVPAKPLVNCNAKTVSTDDRHCLRLLFVAHFICNGCHISWVLMKIWIPSSSKNSEELWSRKNRLQVIPTLLKKSD